VSKAVRSGRGPQAARLVASLKTKDAADRALAIAVGLRVSGGWGVTSASVYQGWTVQLEGTRYRIESVVSAFLEGTRGPGFVFNVTIRSPRAKRAIREHVISTPWLRDLQARLGQEYASGDDRPERISLVRVLRGTTDASTVLDELHHVATAVEGKAFARRRNRAPSRRAKELEEQRDDVWTILDALRATGWRVSSIAQTVQRQVQHDGCRWHVSTSFIALVDSAENRPGFVGTVDSWSRRGERAKRRNPISKASGLLRKNGYRRLAETHYQCWHRGLGLRAAEHEIRVLTQAMKLVQAG
jgi:hypothetical protein